MCSIAHVPYALEEVNFEELAIHGGYVDAWNSGILVVARNYTGKLHCKDHLWDPVGQLLYRAGLCLLAGYFLKYHTLMI